MTSRTYVAWVGTIPFVKPGANAAYHVMGVEGRSSRSAAPASTATSYSRPRGGIRSGQSGLRDATS
jgi:hypothetical protein